MKSDARVLLCAGGLSVAVPGELAGLAEAHKEFGKLPWATLIQPVIRLCREGFPVTRHLSICIAEERQSLVYEPSLRYSSIPFITINLHPHFWVVRKRLLNPETKRPYREGEIMRRPDLARTLEQIAIDGDDAFYSPECSNFSRTFLKEIQNAVYRMPAGSLITADDLKEYQAQWKEPLKVSLGNLTLLSASLPGSGALLAFILQMATRGGVDPLDSGDPVLGYHRLMEYFKFAYARRQLLEDSQDPRVLKVELDHRLISQFHNVHL
ncbi:Gamma-glutamyltranspeptidase [Cordylochernes scorpioides]|uniref:Gamma-glutamyltranspeptidase n=1 Tax=Cordylochernes scorpioides TaxID=51811 RepID=A0ABY6KT09_9ARAC|nr:Gamma-glutamyltranspeptidase [Cordylochernes scorpioides]